MASSLGIDNLKVSNGPLDCIKKHNNIYSRSCGESSSVDNSAVQEWRESLPDLIVALSLAIFLMQMRVAYFTTCSPSRRSPSRVAAVKDGSCAVVLDGTVLCQRGRVRKAAGARDREIWQATVLHEFEGTAVPL